MVYLFGNMFFVYTRRLIAENNHDAEVALTDRCMKLRYEYLLHIPDQNSGMAANERPAPSDGTRNERPVSRFDSFVQGIIRRAEKGNLYLYPTDIEAETIAFLLFPLIGRVSWGLAFSGCSMILVTLVFVWFHHRRVSDRLLFSKAKELADAMKGFSGFDFNREKAEYSRSFHATEGAETRDIIRYHLLRYKLKEDFGSFFKTFKASWVTQSRFHTFIEYLTKTKQIPVGQIELVKTLERAIMTGTSPEFLDAIIELSMENEEG
jgi:hypothetical protein